MEVGRQVHIGQVFQHARAELMKVLHRQRSFVTDLQLFLGLVPFQIRARLVWQKNHAVDGCLLYLRAIPRLPQLLQGVEEDLQEVLPQRNHVDFRGW